MPIDTVQDLANQGCARSRADPEQRGHFQTQVLGHRRRPLLPAIDQLLRGLTEGILVHRPVDQTQGVYGLELAHIDRDLRLPDGGQLSQQLLRARRHDDDGLIVWHEGSRLVHVFDYSPVITATQDFPIHSKKHMNEGSCS
jgi:hypothetical protein